MYTIGSKERARICEPTSDSIIPQSFPYPQIFLLPIFLNQLASLTLESKAEGSSSKR